MELPFGKKPFTKKATPTANANVIKAPSPPPAKEKNMPIQPKRHRKRNQVTIIDTTQGDGNMKGKNIVIETPSTTALIFGDLAKDNFKDEDISSWSKKGKG